MMLQLLTQTLILVMMLNSSLLFFVELNNALRVMKDNL
jgi:hypothetical protein